MQFSQAYKSSHRGVAVRVQQWSPARRSSVSSLCFRRDPRYFESFSNKDYRDDLGDGKRRQKYKPREFVVLPCRLQGRCIATSADKQGV